MKKSIITFCLLLIAFIVTAQQPIIVSIGGGFNNSSSGSKSKAYLGNGYNLQGDIFIPFERKGWDGAVKGSRKFVWGATAGGTYFTSKNLMPDIAGTQAAYQLYSGSLSITNDQNVASSNSGFIASVGLQANFIVGSFILSPSLSGGYLSIKQNGFAQRSTADSKPVILTELPQTKHSGFTVIPQMRISYSVTGNLNIYTSTSFLMGPKITTSERRLVPAGGFNDQHTYEPKQLSDGTMTEKSVNTAYQSLMINAGVSWSIPRSSRHLKGKVTKPGDNGMLRATLSTDSTKKAGGAVSSSYAAGRAVQTDSTKNGGMPGSLSMTPATAPQTYRTGNSDSTKNPLYEAGGHNGNNPLHNPSVFAKPGNPIGGIIVKGGKNPGPRDMIAVSNENGEVTFTLTETGEYTWQIIMPEAPGKSISEQGVKGNPPAKNKRIVTTYSGDRKNEGSNQDILAAPGNPIGGIIVKGGKNPGPRDMIGVSNENGEVIFTLTETGEYILQITMPEAPAKSISEQGVKGNPPKGNKRKGRTGDGRKNDASNQDIQALPGNPIGGIIVKGGKNPGGNMMVIISNDKGEFELNGLETGNYQFTLTTPETPQGKSIREGVKRNETTEAARPGNPIGGIIVKGGKNPGGNMTNLTVKAGIIQFDVLEAGNYKFNIQTPGNTNGSKKEKEKVKEKATSGLKDTLKTNV
ncbi:hypothetical protein [Ferruginibacter sp. HRS2-29]|uniref:hypothetical protein n=1 Tax=Ferruginibacter sp. HRS2-29 TaxID=2487334 RepID=UPI0020CCE775|nr:hypothetical protein [Ferruginibacter sp. HRS2-29]MCP9750541.1 hypothetical protein [Ferruginibacter sp. HRS2-29]